VKSFSKAQQEQEQLEQREKLAKEKRELLAREKEKKEKRGRKIGINLRKKPKNMET
jgi:hypothetical protein